MLRKTASTTVKTKSSSTLKETFPTADRKTDPSEPPIDVKSTSDDQHLLTREEPLPKV